MITLPFPCLCEICHETEGTGFNYDGFWVCDRCQPEVANQDPDEKKSHNTRRIFQKTTPVIRHTAAPVRRSGRMIQPTGTHAMADEAMHHDHDSNRRDRADAGTRKKYGQQPTKPGRGTESERHQAKGKAKPRHKSGNGGKRH